MSGNKEEERVVCQHILNWLEIEGNFDAAYGQQKTKVGVRPERTSQAWERLRLFLNEKCGLDLQTGEAARGRTRRYRARFSHFFAIANSTGAGVPEGSGAANFDDWLESECVGYSRMHALFKNNPLVRSAFDLRTGSGLVSCSSREKDYSVVKWNSRTKEEEVENLHGSRGEDDDQDEYHHSSPAQDTGDIEEDSELDGGGYTEEFSEPERQGAISYRNARYQGNTFTNRRSPPAPSTISSGATSKRRRSQHGSSRQGPRSTITSVRSKSPIGMRTVQPDGPSGVTNRVDISKMLSSMEQTNEGNPV